MFRSFRRTKIFFIFLGVVVGGYLLADLFGSSTVNVPEEFTTARLQGALIAQDIVNLSNKSVIDLERINELDSKGDFTTALDLTAQVVLQSREIRDQAVALSLEIEKMTKVLPNIEPTTAREAALQSITSRVALINRLITYSGYLGELLDTLRERFSGVSGDRKVLDIIQQVNSEIVAINNFNRDATGAMERFDTIVNK